MHICCAPCLIYPLDTLRVRGVEVTGLFYNPNIHCALEYSKRNDALSVLDSKIEVIQGEYSPQDFFRAVNLKEDFPGRCAICWRLRLKKTARVASLRGFKYFSTTLLVSPYQDHESLKKIGAEAGREEGVEFYYVDFRPGFRKAMEEARQKGIYTQKYCGCIYSQIDRNKKK